MDLELFQRITTEMREAGVEEIGCFFLGEPFMSPKLLVECIDWVKQTLQFPYVFLTTNGSLATPEHLDAVMSAGLDSLKFSVNAADVDQFAKVMAVSRKYFKRALRHIRDAREVRDAGKYDCGIYASSIAFDGEQGVRMQEVLEEYVIPFVDEHYVLPLYSMGAFATDREEELGFRPIAGNQGRIGALREPLPCWSAFTEGHVTADGGLSACCFDANRQWLMADLTKTDFMSGWNSSKFRELREAHLVKDVTGTICEKCVAYQ